MLSFDIQVEIIKRLPVKSLIQFRSVCKAWKSLIDSSKFIAGYNVRHDHLLIKYEVGDRQKPEVKYVCFVDDDDDSFPQQKFTLTVPPLFEETIIIGVSHGLLCLVGYFGEPCDPSSKQMVFLWNPAIRKSIVVDVPNVVLGPFNSVLGFGVCPDTKDPKLVKITYNIHADVDFEGISSIPYQVMVFTLSSGEWTCICSGSLARKSILFTSSQTIIGPFIYWLAYDGINGEDDYHNLIMSFDMSTGEFREVDLPDSLVGVPESEFTFSRLRDSLAVFEYNRSGKRVYTVWIMEDGDSKAFTKLFTINPPNASVLSTLGFRKSGEPIVEIEDDNKDYDSAIVVYEPCSEHIKDLGIRGNNYSFFGSFYTESLLLLDHDDGRIISCEELT